MSAAPRVRARLRALVAALLTTVVVASGLTIVASPASAAVPTRPADSSQIVVKTGGTRAVASPYGVGPLAGVQLELRTSGGTLVTTCVSDAGGDCVFTVPNSYSTRSFVVTKAATFQAGSAAAANYYANPEFVTSSNGTSFTQTAYQLSVSNLAQNTTLTVQAGGSNGSTTSGVWQNSYNNPPAQQKCGLNIAVVSDLSYSVAMSNSLGDLQTAARGFVNALVGTPSTVSLYTFGTTAPAPNTSTVLDKSTLNPQHVKDLTAAINAYTISDQSYTNWDAALRQLNGKGYDQIVVITDGNPTRSGSSDSPQGSGANTRFIELEQAIFSANALKASGSRIVTVGVGGSSNFDDGQNLRAISGPTVGSDYFISGWSQLATVLDSLARANCEGTVTVVKKVVPWNATGIADAVPAGGWTFDAPGTTAGTVTPSTSQVTKSNPNQGDNGTINYKLSGIAAGTTFSLAEVQQAGYTLLPQDSKNAVCVTSGSTPVTVTNDGALGFSIPVGKSDIVTCTVYNRAPKPVASLTVHKQWVVNGVPGTLDQFPQGFTASATVGGTATPWNTATEVPTGAAVVDEGTPGVPSPYCRVTGQHVTSFNGGAVGPVDLAGAGSYSTPALAQGSSNSVTITNTVVCDGQLTLLKNVENGTTGGTAVASAWTLTATPTAGAAISGTSGVTGAATAGTTYTLSESGGPAGYRQTAIVCATKETGPWTGPSVSTVTVAAQEHVWCRFTNTADAPRLQLTKVVTGNVVAADKFALTATPTTGAAISGNGKAPYATAVAGRAYTLTEAPVAGFDGSEFTGSAWVCTVTAGPGLGTTVGTGSTVTLALGQDVECIVTNTAKDVVPRFTKDPGTATPDAADGTWDITYTLTATNPSAVLPLGYSLTDAPALPSGVQPVSAVVTRGATTVLSVPNWTGGALSVATGASIPAGGADHVYTVTLTVAIPSTVSPTLLVCGTPGRGFDNSATLTPTTGTPITDTACVTVVPPTVTHDKVVTGLTQDPATGRWTVVYDVSVTATGAGVARYDLSDAFAFGTGVTVVSSSVVAGAGTPAPIAGWTGIAPNTALADEAVLAAGSSHVYTVTAVAAVAAGVTGTDAADCALVAPETGTGFLNRASLTVGGSTTVETACAEPVVPTLDKSFVSATQNPDASWNVTFSILVANAAKLGDTSYSLTDVPGFASGVTITGRDVTVDGAPLAWDGVAPLATDVALPAGESDTYVLVFTVTVDAGMTPALRDCAAAGAGYGFFNAATLTSGADTLTDDDCGPIAESVLPLVAKTVAPGYPHQLADGDWEIRYTVTVSTPAGTPLSTRYDLDDTLRFGAGSTVVAASATGPSGAIAGWTGAAPGVALADDVLLPAGASHVYTVTVRAELPAGFVGSAAGDCTLAAGESGTGFRNTVTLRSGSATREAQACATPARPPHDKSRGGAPVKNTDGTVDLTYTVTVGNPSGLDLVYDLDDALGFALGVLVLDADVTGPAGVTLDPAWTGRGATTRVVTAQALPAGASHVFTVEVHARPTLLVDDADLACRTATPGHGYFNGAKLVSGAEVLTDDACAPIPDSDLPTLPLPPELPTLALTGATAGGGILTAIALLLGGLLLLGMRRRRVAAHRA